MINEESDRNDDYLLLWSVTGAGITLSVSLSEEGDNYADISIIDKETQQALSLEVEAGKCADMALALQAFCHVKGN